MIFVTTSSLNTGDINMDPLPDKFYSIMNQDTLPTSRFREKLPQIVN